MSSLIMRSPRALTGLAVAGVAIGMVAAPSTAASTTGPSSSESPYLVPLAPNVGFTSILTAHDTVPRSGAAAGALFKFVGVPDGLGAFDNYDGTYTVLVNHELTSTEGIDRSTVGGGSKKGAFVSRLVVDKRTNRVLSGRDLDKTVVLAPGDTTLDMNRFCSADLPKLSAFFSLNPQNLLASKGTLARIFMNGEEGGTDRAFAHVATGPYAGTSYELPRFGKQAWENSLANPATGDTTLVALDDDTRPSATAAGNVFMYVGSKTTTGTPVDKAGLTNGELYVMKVNGITAEDRTNALGSGSPSYSGTVSFANLHDVSALSSAQLETLAIAQGTSFLRPEDGAWDPQNPNVYYFVTTDRIDQVKDGTGTQVGRTRLWKVELNDRMNLAAGGTITALLDGTEPVNMLDNLTADGEGHLILLEDVGNDVHNGKMWKYDLATDTLTLLGGHDPARFGDITVPPTAPFTSDEETSGVIPAFNLLGRGWYLIDDQAHTTTGPRVDSETVEDGQLLAMFVPPDTRFPNPSISLAMDLELESLTRIQLLLNLF